MLQDPRIARMAVCWWGIAGGEAGWTVAITGTTLAIPLIQADIGKRFVSGRTLCAVGSAWRRRVDARIRNEEQPLARTRICCNGGAVGRGLRILSEEKTRSTTAWTPPSWAE